MTVVEVSLVPAGPAVYWFLYRTPEGTLVPGVGRTLQEAEADARRRWVPPLAIDGHAYRRRLRNRVKRRRRR